MTDEPARAIVAVQTPDGRVVYEYGWVGPDGASFDWHEASPRGPRSYTSTVSWLEKPRRSSRYPTDADFARPVELEAARQALAQAPREIAES